MTIRSYSPGVTETEGWPGGAGGKCMCVCACMWVHICYMYVMCIFMHTGMYVCMYVVYACMCECVYMCA